MPFAPITLSLLLAWAPGDLGEWKRVTSTEGGYAVTMPGKVEKKTITEKTEDGPAEVRAVMAEVDGITFLATGPSTRRKWLWIRIRPTSTASVSRL